MALTSDQLRAVARRSAARIYRDKTAAANVDDFLQAVTAWEALITAARPSFVNALPPALAELSLEDRSVVMMELLREMGPI